MSWNTKHTRNKTKILIVENEPARHRTCSEEFTKLTDYEFVTAHSTAEVFDRLSDRPEVLLLEIHFDPGDRDGPAFVRSLRERGYGGILCIFAQSPDAERMPAFALAGADGYFVNGDFCNLAEEVRHLCEESPANRTADDETALADSSFLRSVGLTKNQRVLLGQFAAFGYPRVKEFAGRIQVSETSLWKRLERIRTRLEMDSMSQIAHLLTVLSMLNSNLDYKQR